MSAKDKQQANSKALNTTLTLLEFCIEINNFVLRTYKSLFEKILARKDLSEEEKENQIDIATAGILVFALSSYYTLHQSQDNKEDKPSPYLWVESGSLRVPYYPKLQKEVLAISGMNDATESDNENVCEYNERLALAVGTKVMNGELPFQPEILNKIFEKMGFYGIIKTNIKLKYILTFFF